MFSGLGVFYYVALIITNMFEYKVGFVDDEIHMVCYQIFINFLQISIANIDLRGPSTVHHCSTR